MSDLSHAQFSSDVIGTLSSGSVIPGKPAKTVSLDTQSFEDLLKKWVIFVEPRVLVRECLVRAVKADNEINIVGACSIDEALEKSAPTAKDLCLLGISGAPAPGLAADIARITSGSRALVAVLADGYNMDDVSRVFDMGATGYISTNLPFEVSVGAIRLLLAGGTFIPANMLLQSRHSAGLRFASPDKYRKMFTERQVDVLEALSKGKANKEIARELKMREGTVKVHVRNLMKLLNAHNRTEVALIAVNILDGLCS